MFNRLPQPSPGLSVSRVAWIVGTATFARFFINTTRRFAYPFAPVLCRGLGVSLTDVTAIIAATQIAGLLGAIIAPLGDRWGYRRMMLAGLASLTLGMATGGILPFYGTVLLAMFLTGLSYGIFAPAFQAYVGQRISFNRRGLAIGIIEMSWAGSSLIGIPLIGLIINGMGWRAPFFVLSGLGLLGIVALGILIPRDRNISHDTPRALNLPALFRQLLEKRAALGAIGFSFLIAAANDNLFVIYGAWLEKTFGFGVVALGIATTVIGVAELSGELLTAAIADRLGLLRMTITGAILAVAGYVLLPFVGQKLPFALTALFFVFFFFEFTIVTAISLYTEVLPNSRATMMSGHAAAGSLGRVVGALIGGPVWLMGGVHAVGLVSAAITGLGILSLLWGFRDWQPTHDV